MYNNDYIIAVDENGQPYIAHAYTTDGKGSNSRQGIRNGFKAGIGSGLRAAWGSLSGRKPKYDQKEFKNGRWNYIYDEAKKAAKKAWGSKVGRFIDEHDAGVSERLMARRASRKAKQSAKKGDRDAAKYYARRSRELNQESAAERNRAKRTVDAARQKAYDSTVGRVKDYLGYDEREARDKAYQALLNGSYNERTEAGKRHRLKETQDAYAKTLLGRYDQWNSRRKVKKATKK